MIKKKSMIILNKNQTNYIILVINQFRQHLLKKVI